MEKSYRGEVVWAPGYTVGYLEQEPQMDPDKTVLEVVQEGVQEVMDLLSELNKEGTTIVMVTHSQKDSTFAQRVIDLFDGRIVNDVKNLL